MDKIFKAILEISKISFIPSIHLIDIMVGIIVAALIKVIVYTKGKNAKKFRQGKEYGSARWGSPKEKSLIEKASINIKRYLTKRFLGELKRYRAVCR